MTSNSSGATLSTELILLRAIEAGLAVQDFEVLTAGMIFDMLIIAHNEQRTDGSHDAREATQEDFDRF